MLATARHETYYFPTGEYFSEQPEVGKSYFDKYDPILAVTQVLKNRAIANGNMQQGDGYKYRGRGCVHLTWKNNYQKAKDKFGVDFVNQPELAADFKHAVPIMIWGMEEGIFTGKKLSTYMNNNGMDYESARKLLMVVIKGSNSFLC
ncbi:glycoside hydrolase family 19 protein [Klebsiella quasipneumoniae]|uniref:glycoside hydrolase family 19 protein n=1 Tax=Klebsiella quasipneumoniae TaxID=1463165 RepID=UPI00388E7E15